MKKSARRLLIIAALVGMLGIAAYGFVALRPIAVSVALVETRVPIVVFGLGTVEARTLAEIGFEVPGTVMEILADHGDRVARGAPLARLESAEQQARIAKTEALVQQSEAALGKALASLERAKAVAVQRKQSNRRNQTLAKENKVSQEMADETAMAEAVAVAEVKLAESDIAVARSAIADAKAQLQLETAILQQHSLAAPFDAIVVRKHSELGVVVNAGQAVFTLVDPASIWGLTYVDEAVAGELKVGLPAQVRLRSQAKRSIDAHVVRIDIESDRISEERRIYVVCNQCPPEFHLGEQIEVHITKKVLDNVVTIPEIAALRFDGATARVWTVEDGAIGQRDVAISERTLDGRLVLAEAPPDGIRIISETRSGLRLGRAARVVESPPQ